MKVSVIVPVFNAGKYVAEAVSSIANQEHVHEIVLVEDGSTDKSLLVCEQLVETHRNVRLFTHPNGENRGAGASRNLGVNHARSDLIAFLDADDICLPERFGPPLKELRENPELDGVYEAIGTMFENEAAKENWKSLGWGNLTTIRKALQPEELFYYLVTWEAGHFSLNGLLVRKETFLKAGGFNESLKIGEDTDLSIKLSAVGRLAPGRLTVPVALRRVREDIWFVKSRNEMLRVRLAGWSATDAWAKKTRQKRARRLLVGYRLSKVLSKHSRVEQKYPAAIFHVLVSRLMKIEISARRIVLGASSF